MSKQAKFGFDGNFRENGITQEELKTMIGAEKVVSMGSNLDIWFKGSSTCGMDIRTGDIIKVLEHIGYRFMDVVFFDEERTFKFVFCPISKRYLAMDVLGLESTERKRKEATQ